MKTTDLDNENIDIKNYYSTFIKDKSIEQLLDKDNKIFADIKVLENEKHVMVTQNYKKFVTATETINSIKFSLLDFEKDLGNLQDKIKKLVNSYNIVNEKVDPLVKKADKIYKLKRDLKRLKFINDLPLILEKSLKEYNNSDNKDVNKFSYSLTYYQKCKDFIFIHKDHSLVADIYTKSQDAIYKIKNIIQDYLIIPDFSETQLNLLKSCLSLLVKIEDNKSDLIFTFVERYKLVINKIFDEYFAMKENVDEINYVTYCKIYNSFEFSINENEFVFYENQINDLEKNTLNVDESTLATTTTANAKNTSVLNSIAALNTAAENNFKDNVLVEKNSSNDIKLSISNQKTIDIKSLNSKYFKKGTLIWISKKVCENIVVPLIEKAYSTFVELFEDKYISNLNYIYNTIIDIYSKKLISFINQHNLVYENVVLNKNYKYNIDSNNQTPYKKEISKRLKIKIDYVFLKESLSCFYDSFVDSLKAINNTKIHPELIIDSICLNNNNAVNLYFDQLHKEFTNSLYHFIKKSYINLEKSDVFISILENISIDEFNNNYINYKDKYFNIDIVKKETSIMLNNFERMLFKKLNKIKELDNENNFFSNTQNKSNSDIQYKKITNLIQLMLNIFNNVDKFYDNNTSLINDILKLTKQNFDLNNKINFKYFDNKINRKLHIIGITFLKILTNNEYNKHIIEKTIKTTRNEKTKKLLRQELNNFIVLESSTNLKHLEYNFILNESQYLFKKQKLFLYKNITLNLIKEDAISFRKEIRNLFIEFYLFKNIFYFVLNEEKNKFLQSSQNNKTLHNNIDLQDRKNQIHLIMQQIQIKKLQFNNDYSFYNNSPQILIRNLCYMFFKNLIELLKLIKFNKFMYQQVYFDCYFIKNFIKDYIIDNDNENLIEGFHREVKNILMLNCIDSSTCDSDIMAEIYYQFKQEFNNILSKDIK